MHALYFHKKLNMRMQMNMKTNNPKISNFKIVFTVSFITCIPTVQKKSNKVII